MRAASGGEAREGDRGGGASGICSTPVTPRAWLHWVWNTLVFPPRSLRLPKGCQVSREPFLLGLTPLLEGILELLPLPHCHVFGGQGWECCSRPFFILFPSAEGVLGSPSQPSLCSCKDRLTTCSSKICPVGFNFSSLEAFSPFPGPPSEAPLAFMCVAFPDL